MYGAYFSFVVYKEIKCGKVSSRYKTQIMTGDWEMRASVVTQGLWLTSCDPPFAREDVHIVNPAKEEANC